jgi:hypothetical protein
VTDHRAKLEWAARHLDRLDREMERFCLSDDIRATTRRDEVTEEHVASIHFPRHSPPDWSLQVGDIVHNLRSSLDAVTYALSVHHSGVPSDRVARDIQFPLVDTPSEWASKKKHVRLVKADVQDLIELAQPYHRTDPRFKHPLSVLRDLSNIDKHRHLHLARGAVTKSSIQLTGPDLPTGTELSGYRGPIGEHAEVARWRYATEPLGPVRVTAKAELAIVFQDGPAATGGVIAFLRHVHAHISETVLPGLEAHLE